MSGVATNVAFLAALNCLLALADAPATDGRIGKKEKNGRV
jgi:hypothetical protein